jgi:hypothetical protein
VAHHDLEDKLQLFYNEVHRLRSDEQIAFANSITAEFDIDLYANPYNDPFYE